ncbi:uncharacterized protein FOMMEDRAFT_149162 [Fomitiporia mediterranea MF3/22]|uniref:uncharacterized protein n=1 Tax=Fomitiporia mediterranea (strain MF3/22) TaxID=694068 RepID=UPI0004409603|nr:uncharacterized protein FOMMEDRAFT_149162 [Fomitiporia mediterranea MF3/22]EJC98365.1 hypothetical protein FOMMEDRAFT_149162 [Fomitiporia mediterranea MF3/22]
MAPFTVPPEVARRIARAAADRRTLALLASTSRTLQDAAEKLLYENIELFPHPIQFYLLETLAECPRVAAHVRTYTLSPTAPYRIGMALAHEREMQRTIQATIVRREFWERVSASLVHLTQLDLLILVDPTVSHSWVLDRARTLRTTEARLGLAWDERVAAFLETQDRLRCLTVSEVAENAPLAPLSANALPCLVQFEGPLLVLDFLLHCPITHLKFPIDSEDAVSLLPLVLPELHRLKKLRSLSITTMPPELFLPSMSTISEVCPNLQYLSHIPLPMDHRSHITLLSYLSRLTHLKVLEVDVQHWVPPLTSPFQRAVAASIHVVLPSLRYIFFWTRYDRTLWMWNPEDVEPIQVRSQVTTDPLEVQEEEPGGAGRGRTGTGNGAGAGTGAGMATLEETTTYVGLEGWRHSWNGGHSYPNNSSVWKSAV